MLDYEAAAERLKEFRTKAPALARTWRVVVGLTPSEKANEYVDRFRQNGMSKVGATYRTAGSLRRKAILKASAPKFIEPLRQAVESVHLLPYQTGYSRLPFRAPQLAEVQDGRVGNLLQSAFLLTKDYDQPITFFAEWGGYLSDYGAGADLPALLSSAIDQGDGAVYDILVKSVRGEHPVGFASRTAIRALLGCSRPEAWREVENLLLKAQREEGLRQVVFESVDELHPEAFQRFLRTIIEHDLLRFSSVIRAFAVWLPAVLNIEDSKGATASLQRLLEFLSDADLEPEESESDIYLRLWADAYRDVSKAYERAERYYDSTAVAVRKAVVTIADHIGLSLCWPLLRRALKDPDREVAFIAVHALGCFQFEHLQRGDFAQILREVAESWPKDKKTFGRRRPAVWDLLLYALQDGDLATLKDNVYELSSGGRASLALRLANVKDFDARRRMAFALFADVSPDVRERAMKSLVDQPLQTEEAIGVEALLRRKAADLRQSSLLLLSKQSPDRMVESGQRLIASSDKLQKQAGLELLKKAAGEGSKEAKQALLAHESEDSELGDHEGSSRLKLASGKPVVEPLPENGLGLFSIEDLTFANKPVPNDSELFTHAAIACLNSLDDLVHANRDLLVTVPRWWYLDHDGETVDYLLGDVGRHFVAPRDTLTYEQQRARLPIADLLEEWERNRPPTLRDKDGHELFRACVLHKHLGETAREAAGGTSILDPLGLKLLGRKPKYFSVTAHLVTWAAKLSENHLRAPVLIEMLANQLSTINEDRYRVDTSGYRAWEVSWRTSARVDHLVDALEKMAQHDRGALSDHDIHALYPLLRYIDEPRGRKARGQADRQTEDLRKPGSSYEGSGAKVEVIRTPIRMTPPLVLIDRAIEAGACTEQDVIDYLRLELRTASNSHLLSRASEPFKAIVRKFVARIVEVESERGDLPTGATGLANDVTSCVHLAQVRQLLRAKIPLIQNAYGTMTSKAAVFSRLLSLSFPAPDESPELAGQALIDDGLDPVRLVELAMIAPQWGEAVEIAVRWKGLADVVWWFHCHAKEGWWAVTPELKEIWKGEASERTPLTEEQFGEGAVDVAWFNRFAPRLDDKQWSTLEKVAKLSSTGRGHGRAKLFAKALRDQISVTELAKMITEKRNPDAVRALGLVPLGADKEADVRSRYGVMQEFLRTSRKFGSMRQASEKTAVRVGLENLARTAGYPDPMRLSWALEASEVDDLKGGGLTVELDEIQVTLAFDDLGEPIVSARKKGVKLADIPAAARKVPEVKGLLQRRTDLKKQAQRTRLALEQAMQRGDLFDAAEVARLMEHPGLAPILRNLVFLAANGSAGFLNEEGALPGCEDKVCIAHPHDLLVRGDWPDWQKAVFLQERVQPFKQVFRELYVPTDIEKTAFKSTRYAGHQLRLHATLSILGKRGWVARYEEGVSKSLHEAGLTAWIEFEESFFTPADIEGLTLAGLHFTKSATGNPVALSEVPPKVFSETMRDLDLVVSVAASVGIDPEASESTIEMRANVIRETARLLKLDNVAFGPKHAMVKGALGDYTIHLGSAVVHQRAKGELVIITVRQPQRGRLFLPFIDDDPRTAEIVSKVVLLARDRDIKDPTILSQIANQ